MGRFHGLKLFLGVGSVEQAPSAHHTVLKCNYEVATRVEASHLYRHNFERITFILRAKKSVTEITVLSRTVVGGRNLSNLKLELSDTARLFTSQSPALFDISLSDVVSEIDIAKVSAKSEVELVVGTQASTSHLFTRQEINAVDQVLII
jgi:hypothetical protein